jgi:hypothetical protein
VVIPAGGWLASLRRLLVGGIVGKALVIIGLFVLLAVLALIDKSTGGYVMRRIGIGGDPPGEHRKELQLTVLAVFPNPDTSSVSKPMVDRLGFGNGEQRIPLYSNVYLERLWEGATPEETARRVSARLQKDDVILVMGHERSTVVEYMNHAVYENPKISAVPIPLILPAATNPDLTANSGTKRHVLRLPATDAQQVAALTAAIGRLSPKRITIVRDKSNPIYSTYIGEQLISKLPHVEQSVGLDVDLASAGVPPEVLTADTLVIAGMENLAKVLLAYARSHGARIGSSPRMIFTDGVAGVVFETAARQILDNNDRVYLSGPFPTDRPKGSPLERFPNYEPYADLARNVAYRLLDETKEREPITREAVLTTLWHWLDDGRSRSFGDTAIAFNPRGDNVLAPTHIFEITNRETFHSLICVCKSE